MIGRKVLLIIFKTHFSDFCLLIQQPLWKNVSESNVKACLLVLSHLPGLCWRSLGILPGASSNLSIYPLPESPDPVLRLLYRHVLMTPSACPDSGFQVPWHLQPRGCSISIPRLTFHSSSLPQRLFFFHVLHYFRKSKLSYFQLPELEFVLHSSFSFIS